MTNCLRLSPFCTVTFDFWKRAQPDALFWLDYPTIKPHDLNTYFLARVIRGMVFMCQLGALARVLCIGRGFFVAFGLGGRNYGNGCGFG